MSAGGAILLVLGLAGVAALIGWASTPKADKKKKEGGSEAACSGCDCDSPEGTGAAGGTGGTSCSSCGGSSCGGGGGCGGGGCGGD